MTAPKTVGTYQLVRQLGTGGMGTVYEGVHAQLGKRVAVKLLHPQLAAHPEVGRRFFEEARALALVEHPGLVSILEFGHASDGSAYLVMEYLRGESLLARLRRRGRLPIPEALRLARQVAVALQAAHEHGVVHRDLKPDNIMIVADPEAHAGERTKLIDFGIAKIATSSAQTQSGLLMGTPLYMAPEQCRGAGGVDHRVDVYALGVILYQMLCGEPPFTAEGAGEVMLKHLTELPPPLGPRVPGLPAGVASLVEAMLAKERDARPDLAQVARLQELRAPRADLETVQMQLLEMTELTGSPFPPLDPPTVFPPAQLPAAPPASQRTPLSLLSQGAVVARRQDATTWRRLGWAGLLLFLVVVGVFLRTSRRAAGPVDSGLAAVPASAPAPSGPAGGGTNSADLSLPVALSGIGPPDLGAPADLRPRRVLRRAAPAKPTTTLPGALSNDEVPVFE